MAPELILTGARLVLRDRVLDGTLDLRDGRIAAIDAERSQAPNALDLDGDFLIPGLIEMHTDNLEKHLMPRPGVEWPSALAALMTHDAQTAGAGITTVLDSIFVGEYLDKAVSRTACSRKDLLQRSLEAIRTGRDHGYLRAEHHLHLRCELADSHMAGLFQDLVDTPFLKLVSIMDHTPGQRQWSDLEKWRLYHSEKKWTEDDARRVFEHRLENQRRYAGPGRETVTRLCRERNIPLASHDDTTTAHAEESAACGVVISEFPTTLAAARRARELGLTVTMGAPNVVRGGSHSGNVSALDLAAAGLLDALSSDYVPISLLHGAFLLHQRLDLPLPQAVATVSANLADVLGFTDRGELAPGKRADLVRVRVHEDVPIVRAVWREGERVA